MKNNLKKMISLLPLLLSLLMSPLWADINPANPPTLTSNAALTPDQQLLMAVQQGLLENVRTLLANGFVDPNIPFEGGITPLHVSVINNHESVAAVLIQAGARVNTQDSTTQVTPLHLSALYGRTSMAKLLIEKGAHVNAVMKLGITPVMVAAQFKHPQIVELLLTHKANASQADEEGSTPLHIAAENGDEITARLLIKQGVDVNAQNKSQATPLSLALQNNQMSMAELLKQNGAK